MTTIETTTPSTSNGNGKSTAMIQAQQTSDSVLAEVAADRPILSAADRRALHLASARKVLTEVYREAARRQGLLPSK